MPVIIHNLNGVTDVAKENHVIVTGICRVEIKDMQNKVIWPVCAGSQFLGLSVHLQRGKCSSTWLTHMHMIQWEFDTNPSIIQTKSMEPTVFVLRQPLLKVTFVILRNLKLCLHGASCRILICSWAAFFCCENALREVLESYFIKIWMGVLELQLQ